MWQKRTRAFLLPDDRDPRLALECRPAVPFAKSYKKALVKGGAGSIAPHVSSTSLKFRSVLFSVPTAPTKSVF